MAYPDNRQPGLDAVCTGCSLLCDDIRTDDQQLVFANACPRGNDWLGQPSAHSSSAGASIDGARVSTDQAIDRIARELSEARMPLVCGLASESVQAQIAALELARLANAMIDWTDHFSPVAWHAAMQLTGRVTCSMDELANLADLVLIWEANPVDDYPRLLEGYSGEVGAIDSRKTATTESANWSFQWDRQQQMKGLRLLRECVADLEPEQEDSKADWTNQARQLAKRLAKAIFPVIVVDQQFAERTGNVGVMSVSRLIRALNRTSNARLLCLESNSNSRGAYETFSATTGAPFGILFRDHQPMFRGGEATTSRVLKSGHVDLVIRIQNDVGNPWLDDRGQESAAREIVLGPGEDGSSGIVVPAARWGIESGGNGYRTDGTPVCVPAIRESDLPDVADILRRITQRFTAYAD